MAKIKIGVGLYIVREDAKMDLNQTLSRLREIGYEGVEMLGFFGTGTEALRGMLKHLSIEALGDHISVTDFLHEPKRIIQEHLTVGCRRITLACQKEQAACEPFVKLTEEFTAAAQLCEVAGITPMYHNHDFDMLGDAPFATRILDAVPALRFEPDVGWMTVAGKDPMRYLEKYQDRTKVVHLKDVFIEKKGFSFRPTGYGCVNTPALMPTILACNPEWLMVDHDFSYDRDIYDDLALSFEYVKALMRIVG